MSVDKKRYRWNRNPFLIEENLIIDSQTTRTQTGHEEQQQHIENTVRQWYTNDQNRVYRTRRLDPSNEKLSEKIDRILRRIHAWTNDPNLAELGREAKAPPAPTPVPPPPPVPPPGTTTTTTNFDRENLSNSYVPRRSSRFLDSFRRRCSSTANNEQNRIDLQDISVVRPYSMTFIDRSKNPRNQRRQKKILSVIDDFHSSENRSFVAKNETNLEPLSSLYGSDFFYSKCSGEQHQYDNLILNEKDSSHYYEPFPIVVDHVRHDPLPLQDQSCQVPSDDELNELKLDFDPIFDKQQEKIKRSSPVYSSPRASPTICRPPRARNLLSAHHFRRQHSLSSSVALYARSKSAPSASISTVSNRSARNQCSNNENSSRLPLSLCPLENSTVEPETTPNHSNKSTAAILRSIKASIHAMRKRLKDLRRFSEDSNVTTVLDDYTARSSQELTVSKGQHVRIVQRQLPNAPDWCLIRLLNDHHHHHHHHHHHQYHHHHQQQQQQQQNSSTQSNSTSVVASATTTSGSNDLSSPSSSSSVKYIEGLVPAAILKSAKSSSTNIHPPPLPPSSISVKSEHDTLTNQPDESQQRQSSASTSSALPFSKRKASFRRILKNPVRRLSLKENPTNNSKDTKGVVSARDISGTSTDSTEGLSSTSRRAPTSLNSTSLGKLKSNNFPNSEDLRSLPDDTSSANKIIDGNLGMNGIFKMTEPSSSHTISSTVISGSSTLASDDLENETIEVPPPMNIQAQPKLSADGNVDQIPSNDETSNLAPISIVAGLTGTDFHIPTTLSVTTPVVHDSSSLPVENSMIPSSQLQASSICSPSTGLTTSEQNDETSSHDFDPSNEPSTATTNNHTTNDEPVDDRTKYTEKRRHNILELIETEKEYVKDLALIVEGYMNVIENDKDIKKPAGLIGFERVVFGNVQRIYEFHRDTFLPQLEQCIENPNILGRLFTTNRFSPYVRYCENKPRSEYIVSEYHDFFEEIRKKLGQRLLVSDLLIKPVQRIMRYQLLLKEILRSTQRMGDESRAISGALEVMIEVPRQANDMMNVGRIKDLPTNVHQLGELKLQDIIGVSEPIGKETTRDAKELEKKLKERRVFLFQQAMVFCEEIPAKDKYSSPNYIYKYDLKINKLQHKEFKGNKELCQFTLVEVDAGNTRRVICQCKDDEQYELWVTNVEKVLQRQMDLIIALTNPTAALQKDPRSK